MPTVASHILSVANKLGAIAATTVVVTIALSMHTLDVLGASVASIGGRVVREHSGEPVSGVYVTLMHADWIGGWRPANQGGAAKTDENGKFELGCAPQGVMTLIVSMDVERKAVLLVAHVEAKDALPLVLAVPTPGRVEGHVLDGAGQPFRHHRISLVHQLYEISYEATTGNTGEFICASVMPGDYVLTRATTGGLEGLDDTAAAAFNVASGTTTKITVGKRFPTHGRTVSGVVFDAGAPVAGGTIAWWPLDDPSDPSTLAELLAAIRLVPINGDGKYEITGLTSGIHAVQVIQTRPAARWTDMVRTGTTEASWRGLNIDIAGATIRGTARTVSKEAVPDVMVHLTRCDICSERFRSLARRRTIADSSGRFSFTRLSPGRYVLEFVSDQASCRREVAIGKDATIDVDLVSQQTVRIQGAVECTPPGAIPARIAVMSMDGALLYLSPALYEEAYKSPALYQGRFRLFAFGGGGYSCLGRELDLQSDRELDIILEPAGKVVVRLLGKPDRAAGRMVSLTSRSGQKLLRLAGLSEFGSFRFLATMPADESGVAVLDNVPPGVYVVDVPGYRAIPRCTVQSLAVTTANMIAADEASATIHTETRP